MPQRKLVTHIALDRAGRAYQFFQNFEKNSEILLKIDDQLALTTKADAEIDAHLPQDLREVPLLRIVYTGQLGGPGVNKLFAFSRALRLTSSAPVLSAGTLFLEDGTFHFHPAENREWSWGPSKEQISPKDCEAAARILADTLRISELEMDVYNRLTNAHRFFDNAYGQSNADMAIVGFTTALEGLFLNSEQELSFRFCLRIAQFLGTTPEEMQKIFARAKELYTCRSKIVHGAAVRKDSELAAIYVVDDVAPFAGRLARNVLLKIYEHGLTRIFESGERVDRLFNELLFAEDRSSVIGSHGSHS
jgi:hypothetical protein